MLFEDNELASDFDFGNTVTDSNASLKCLSIEIFRVAQHLKDLKEKRLPVLFRHSDNNGKQLYIQAHHAKGGQDIYDRCPEEICQILYKKGRNQTISGFLEKMGIENPGEGTPYYKEYLQLLYFFYMMRNFAFENDSFFRMVTKTPTSELSPVEGASQGKYLWFILANLMDDKTSCEIFVHQDIGYSRLISLITQKIDCLFNETNLSKNEKIAQEIEKVIDGCNGVPPREWHGGIILRAMGAVYQYQMLGYSGDMIRNLRDWKRPFDFQELEINAPLEKWQNRFLEYSHLDDFLKEKEVAFFCKQETNLTRPDKALRNGPTEIVKYVFREDMKQDSHLFIQINEEGKARISALIAAVIAKTYLDLANEKILVDIKKKNGWDHEVAFKNALASSNGESRLSLAANLAYRLFIVAFHSEFMNTKWGHGYWSVFNSIYLRRYLYVQKCVKIAFSGCNPNEWRDRLHYLIFNLPVNDQNNA